jgi:hypothetical protein
MAKSIFEEALASIGAAIADVREKVVEEGYFGRVVTNGSETSPESTENNAGSPGFGSLMTKTNFFDECLAEKLQEASPANTDKTRDNPEPGGGMEH